MIQSIPSLQEIHDALVLLIEFGDPTCIDLPVTDSDERLETGLLEELGLSLTELAVPACGRSTVQSTRYAGVWVVTRRRENGEIAARFIEVAFVPGLLESSELDVMRGFLRMSSRLDAYSPHMISDLVGQLVDMHDPKRLH